MSIVFERIYSWNDFDFDALFEASKEHLQANFFSNIPFAMSDEQKKEYYKQQLQTGFNGTDIYLKKENEEFFCFKGTVDGIVMEFGAGYIEEDTCTLRFHWYLTAPDINGSRNILHVNSTADIRKPFYAQHGITRYRLLSSKDSDLHKWFRSRVNSGKQKLVSEGVINEIPNVVTEIEMLIEL